MEAAVAEVAGRSGPWVTPLVLERVAAATGGRTTAANVALAEHNAGVAAAIATALVAMSRTGSGAQPLSPWIGPAHGAGR